MRDLEIALVLAREMKAAAARSVDASLRLDQLQEVFGVEELDATERARIQTALQMAGLEPFPSLLEADPSEPIRFGAAKTAAPAGATTAGTTPAPPSKPPPEPPDETPTFPTVGQFARSKLGRSKRARRGDHTDDRPPPPPPPEAPLDELPPLEPSDEPLYHQGDALAEEAGLVDHHEPEHANGGAPVEDLAGADEAEAEAEAQATEVHERVEEPPEDLADAAAAHDVTRVYKWPAEAELVEEERPEMEVEVHESVDEEADAYEAESAEAEAEAEDEPHDGHPPHERDEREYIPLVAPEEIVAEAAHPADPPSPTPAPAEPATRPEEVIAALLPAVAIPVIVTSIAGWKFGLPFVALSVIATGILLSRREQQQDGHKRGLLATLRDSPATATVLKTTAAVTALSVVASVVLASVGKDSGSSNAGETATPAKKPPPAASKPAPTKPAPKPAKPADTPKPADRKKPAAKKNEPAPDPGTEGLVRVPPGGNPSGSGPNGTGTPSTPSAGPGTGTTQPTP